MRYDLPHLQEHLAAQYVLGTLSPRARRRLEGLARTRPALRERLDAWTARLGALHIRARPAQATPALWAGIEARLFPARPGGEPAQARARGRFGWLWSSLSGLAGAALAVLVLVQNPAMFTSTERLAAEEQALPHAYVGILADAQGETTLLISSTRHGRRLFVKPVKPLAAQPGEKLVLLAHAPGAADIVLGEITGQPGKVQELKLAQPAEALFKPVKTLSVRAVAADGSSRELARGLCAKVW
ncbi:MAG: hypothetical protein EPO01_17965 [Aquabacterium sp.]|nr:MAG: hypothetical protein EPO01_17965 [Aquabacterium sp.]